MSDCAIVKELLSLPDVACCDSCHEDAEEYGFDLCEIEVGGDSYWVCCYVQVAAFAPQKLNQHAPEPPTP